MIMTDEITSRIIRLKNGDDVIAKIVKSDRKKLTLQKPFLFRTQSELLSKYLQKKWRIQSLIS